MKVFKNALKQLILPFMIFNLWNGIGFFLKKTAHSVKYFE